MVTLTLNIELSDSTPEAEAEFLKQFAEYITNENGSIIEDYGPKAWGGYDGPVIKRLDVSHNGIIESSWDQEFGQTP